MMGKTQEEDNTKRLQNFEEAMDHIEQHLYIDDISCGVTILEAMTQEANGKLGQLVGDFGIGFGMRCTSQLNV